MVEELLTLTSTELFADPVATLMLGVFVGASFDIEGFSELSLLKIGGFTRARIRNTTAKSNNGLNLIKDLLSKVFTLKALLINL